MLRSSTEPFGYTEDDLFWVYHQPLLLSRGYTLRPRYQPDWVGSWKTNGKKPTLCEDIRAIFPWNVMDARRTRDNVKVSLKLVSTWNEEIPIARFLSSETRLNDHRNRTVPILDVIPLALDDETALLVMPFLRAFDNPPFQFLDECIEAIRQMLNGLVFMHEQNVAHRDACWGNIMMDSSRLIPGGFHHLSRWSGEGEHWLERITFDLTRRSVAPVDYYFIDFGLSSRFASFEERSYVVGVFGQNKTVPELSDTVPYDPFAVDVYQLGGVIKELIKTYHGLRVLRPLSKSMSRQKPSARPTASEALRHFEKIVSKIRPKAMEARVVLYKDWRPAQIWGSLRKSLRLASDDDFA